MGKSISDATRKAENLPTHKRLCKEHGLKFGLKCKCGLYCDRSYRIKGNKLKGKKDVVGFYGECLTCFAPKHRAKQLAAYDRKAAAAGKKPSAGVLERREKKQAREEEGVGSGGRLDGFSVVVGPDADLAYLERHAKWMNKEELAKYKKWETNGYVHYDDAHDMHHTQRPFPASAIPREHQGLDATARYQLYKMLQGVHFLKAEYEDPELKKTTPITHLNIPLVARSCTDCGKVLNWMDGDRTVRPYVLKGTKVIQFAYNFSRQCRSCANNADLPRVKEYTPQAHANYSARLDNASDAPFERVRSQVQSALAKEKGQAPEAERVTSLCSSIARALASRDSVILGSSLRDQSFDLMNASHLEALAVGIECATCGHCGVEVIFASNVVQGRGTTKQVSFDRQVFGPDGKSLSYTDPSQNIVVSCFGCNSALGDTPLAGRAFLLSTLASSALWNRADALVAGTARPSEGDRQAVRKELGEMLLSTFRRTWNRGKGESKTGWKDQAEAEEWLGSTGGVCAVTGAKLGEIDLPFSIDRIVDELPYSRDNCQLVLRGVNYFKATMPIFFTEEAFAKGVASSGLSRRAFAVKEVRRMLLNRGDSLVDPVVPKYDRSRLLPSKGRIPLASKNGPSTTSSSSSAVTSSRSSAKRTKSAPHVGPPAKRIRAPTSSPRGSAQTNSSSPTPPGLVNSGNDCFAISLAQALLGSSSLLEALEEHDTGCETGVEGSCIACAMFSVLLRLANASPTVVGISIDELMEAIWAEKVDWERGAQQCLAETMHVLLETAPELQDAVAPNLSESRTCGNCRVGSVSAVVLLEGFLVLDATSGGSVAGMLDSYLNPHFEQGWCASCRGHHDHVVERQVISAPPTLFVYLSREHDGQLTRCKTTIPSSLNVPMAGTYELVGAAEHQGLTMASGHYSAYRGSWRFSDMDVDDVEDKPSKSLRETHVIAAVYEQHVPPMMRMSAARR